MNLNFHVQTLVTFTLYLLGFAIHENPGAKFHRLNSLLTCHGATTTDKRGRTSCASWQGVKSNQVTVTAVSHKWSSPNLRAIDQPCSPPREKQAGPFMSHSMVEPPRDSVSVSTPLVSNGQNQLVVYPTSLQSLFFRRVDFIGASFPSLHETIRRDTNQDSV